MGGIGFARPAKPSTNSRHILEAGTCGFDHLLPARAAAIRFSFSSVAITVIS
jgi:hypothetical protein